MNSNCIFTTLCGHQGCAGVTDWAAGPTLTWMLGWRVCQIQEGQDGFHLGRGTVEVRVLKGALESAQLVSMCFLDLDKSYSRVSQGMVEVFQTSPAVTRTQTDN